MASKTPVKLGGGGTGDTTTTNAKILKEALSLPIQLVMGYKGTSDMRLAAESGELAGACFQWESIKTTWSKGLDSGEVVVVIQPILNAIRISLASRTRSTRRKAWRHAN